jgi:hypothetical protein
MFQIKVVEKVKTHVLCYKTAFRKSSYLWGNVEKYGKAREATKDNAIWRMRFACWISKNTIPRARAPKTKPTSLQDSATEYHNIILCTLTFPHWTYELLSL